MTVISEVMIRESRRVSVSHGQSRSLAADDLHKGSNILDVKDVREALMEAADAAKHVDALVASVVAMANEDTDFEDSATACGGKSCSESGDSETDRVGACVEVEDDSPASTGSAEHDHPSAAASVAAAVSAPALQAYACESSEYASTSCQNTLIVFDWDDTLLPSSWLVGNGVLNASPLVMPIDMQPYFVKLEAAVVTLLSLATMLGNVCIVTNAEEGWVEQSAEVFLPRAVGLLKRCKIVSARSSFEEQHPEEPTLWKKLAFQQVATDLFARVNDASRVVFQRQLLSVGDSMHERFAAHHVGSLYPAATIKSVKLVEHPTPETMSQQLELVSTNFYAIVSHAGVIDVALAPTKPLGDDGESACAVTA